jgi:hypothetical protein
MFVNFVIKGRLGNAIFRYMASVIMCLYYNGVYTIRENFNFNCNDDLFLEIFSNLQNNNILSLSSKNINMNGFYQHDLIYKMNKNRILDFIKNHSEHYILTDGINAVDGNYEKFYMNEIVNTPINFQKRYKNVLHIRLEDFVTHNLFLPYTRIIQLLQKNIINDELCIVCKKPSTDFEDNYIKQIVNYCETKNIKIILEHNETLTDYYIMKESEILICSKSTLSWCSAFFSESIKKCYIPDYTISNNSTCKYPIDNTELY